MRVLFITPYLPNNLRPRPLNLLKHLAERHRISLLSPVFNAAEIEQAHGLGQELPGLKITTVFCSKLQSLRQCLTAWRYRQPMQARYCYHPALVEAARQLLKANSYDLVHIEHFRAAYSGRELHSSGVPVIYDAVDSITLLTERALHNGPVKQRAISRLELNATRRYERELIQAGYFQKVCVTSREDGAAFERLAGLAPGEGQLEVVPNGVDTELFAPPAPETQREPAAVIFSGKMSYHSNAAAARYLVKEIWPLVLAARPDARLWIAGSAPPNDLLAQSGRHGITVTGFVPALTGYLQRATVAVAPLVYSVGIQNKVLEAMACATPTIASEQVSRAINARDGQELGLVPAGQPAEFARQIVELLNNPARAARMGQAGREFVLRNYTWQKAAAQVERVWSATQLKPEPLSIAAF